MCKESSLLMIFVITFIRWIGLKLNLTENNLLQTQTKNCYHNLKWFNLAKNLPFILLRFYSTRHWYKMDHKICKITQLMSILLIDGWLYTMSQDIVQMCFLSITFFFCLDLECSNLDMLLVMNLHIFVLIQTHLSCFSFELSNIYW